MVGVRFSEDFQKEIRDWSVKQSDQPKLATAIRQLVALGLTVKRVARGASPKTAKRAAELAANVIDTQIDPAAPPVERAERKQRILKGPISFREVRKDSSE